MVKNVSNQKEDTKLSGGFNKLLDGVLKFMLILLLLFIGIWMNYHVY